MKWDSIGKQIRYYREKAGFTQQHLGEKVGVSWEMISRYERGASSPANKLDRIAEALNVNPAELLHENNNSSLQQISKFIQNIAPLYVSRPESFNEQSKYFYTIPDWIIKNDRSSFVIDPSIAKIKTVSIRNEGPIYVSPTLQTTENSIVLASDKDDLIIDLDKNVSDKTKIIGVIVAQEIRFI